MSDAPEATQDSLEERDRAVASLSLEDSSAGIELFDDLILELNAGTSLFTGTKHDRGLNFLIALLMNRAFNSLWRARNDAVQGYPVQSLTLCRAALEDWIAVSWIEQNPDERALWLGSLLEEVEHPVDDQGRQRWVPSANSVLSDLGNAGMLPKVAHEQLSKFAHPRGVGLRWQFRFDAQGVDVHAGPRFDANDLRTCLYFLVHVAAGILPAVERLQHRWVGQPDSSWLKSADAAVKRAFEYIEDVGKEVMAAAPEDVDGPDVD